MIKNIKSISLLLFVLFSILNISVLANPATHSYWNIQRKGANIFNQQMTSEIWYEATNANIKIVRLAPDKWHGKERDFLIGNADHYTGLVMEDLIQLKKVLADADKNGVKVVLTMLNLPGNRWKQLNNNRDDSRLWRDERYQQQAIQFWQDLAQELKGNPAIVGYNIINEPHPEVAFGYKDFTTQNFQKFAEKVSGTQTDLTLFYQKMVDAVRKVDPATPIVLDIGMYADPRSFSYFKPVRGENILYAFHMYEPYRYTNKKLNSGKYVYPGKMIIGANNKVVYMDKNKLQSTYFQPVIDWQRKYHIPSSRIFAEEFGGNRSTKGLDNYFHDLISIFNKQGWHWAFYSFREDAWDGMDYELGSKPLGVKYWDAIARGEKPKVTRVPNPVWKIIKQGLSD
jgi:endoglucanase